MPENAIGTLARLKASIPSAHGFWESLEYPYKHPSSKEPLEEPLLKRPSESLGTIGGALEYDFGILSGMIMGGP